MEQNVETAGDMGEVLQTLWKAFHDANNSGDYDVAERVSASIVSLMACRNNLVGSLSPSFAALQLSNSVTAAPWKRLGHAA
jgi:hypothetical protein